MNEHLNLLSTLIGQHPDEIIAEFGLLRDVIQRFAEVHHVNISGEVNRKVNQVIDKAIASSLQTYVRQQAESGEQKRQQYLSFLVHDLRTPISALVTATNVIDQSLAKGKHVERIFESRIGDTNVAGSTGLGLSIVRKVTELHGGKISVDSKPGQGSTFRTEFSKIHSEN